MEMIAYAKQFYPTAQTTTFFESCGVADLITTCYGGRNRKVSEAFVKTGKTIEELEKEMLNGQRLQVCGIENNIFPGLQFLLPGSGAEGARFESRYDLVKEITSLLSLPYRR